jgi:hypothetical protein
LKVGLTRELSPWARSKPLIYAQIVLYLVIFAVLLYTFVPLFLHGLL